MLLSCRPLPFDSIHFTTEWNLHPWDFRTISVELQKDLSENGVIHPPLVIADSDKTYALVAGARRLEFMRRFIGPSLVDCMVIDQDTPHSSILNLILADQSCAFKLSLAEKARFVEIASRSLIMTKIVTAFQEKLQLKNGRSTIPHLLNILQQDEEIIKEIHLGTLQDRMVAEILSLPEKSDRLALVQLFVNLGMGDGKQKRFFSMIRDIAFREGLSITAYLQQEAITEILCHKEMNIPQKIQHLAEFLQNEINPASSSAESEFTKKVKSLRLPINHSISHSASFEKNEITLSITFKDFTDCEIYLSQHQEQL